MLGKLASTGLVLVSTNLRANSSVWAVNETNRDRTGIKLSHVKPACPLRQFGRQRSEKQMSDLHKELRG